MFRFRLPRRFPGAAAIAAVVAAGPFAHACRSGEVVYRIADVPVRDPRSGAPAVAGVYFVSVPGTDVRPVRLVKLD